MIEIVGAEVQSREAIEKIIFFIGGVIRSNHANRGSSALVAHLLQTPRNFLERIFPARRSEFAVAANQRLANALGMIREIESEAPLAAEKFAVDPGLIAIVGAQNFVVAHAQRGLAAIRAVRARIADVGHLPRTRLIAIRAAGQRADGTDIDARATFFAIQRARKYSARSQSERRARRRPTPLRPCPRRIRARSGSTRMQRGAS